MILKKIGSDKNFVARLCHSPRPLGRDKGNSISVGFSPNREHVMMSSLKDTDKKVLRSKAPVFDGAF
jgi:hypothetical protein